MVDDLKLDMSIVYSVVGPGILENPLYFLGGGSYVPRSEECGFLCNLPADLFPDDCCGNWQVFTLDTTDSVTQYFPSHDSSPAATTGSIVVLSKDMSLRCGPSVRQFDLYT